MRQMNQEQLEQQLEFTKNYTKIFINTMSDHILLQNQQAYYLANKLSIPLDIILSQNINTILDETFFVQLCYNFDRPTLHEIEQKLQQQSDQQQMQQQISRRQSILSFEETIRSSLAGTPNIFEEQMRQYSTMQASGLSNLISQEQQDQEEQQEDEEQKLDVNASLSKFFYSQANTTVATLPTNSQQQKGTVDIFTFPYNIEIGNDLQRLYNQIRQYQSNENYKKVIAKYNQQQSYNMPISSRMAVAILDLIENAPENIKIQIAWSGAIGIATTKNSQWIQYYYSNVQKYLKKQIIKFENRLQFPLYSILPLQQSLKLSGIQYTATKTKDTDYRVNYLLNKYGVSQDFRIKSWNELTKQDQKKLLNQLYKIQAQLNYQIITQQIVLYIGNQSISSQDVVEIMNIQLQIGFSQYSQTLEKIRENLQDYIQYKKETLQWFERNDCQIKKGSIVFNMTSDKIDNMDYQLLLESSLLLNVRFWHKNLKNVLLEQYIKNGKLEKLVKNKVDNTPVVRTYLQLQFNKPKRTYEEIRLHFALVFIKRDEATIEYNQYEQGIGGCIFNQDMPLLELQQGDLKVFNQLVEQN